MFKAQGLCYLLLAWGAVGCASVAPSSSASPTVATDAASFVFTLGSDTVSAESYTRTGNRVEGVIARRIPRTVVVRYVMTLAPNGLASRLEYNTRLPDGSMLPNGSRSVIVTFTGDSATTELVRDPPVTRRAAAANAFPELDGGVFFFSLPIAALRVANRDSADFALYSPGATQASVTPVARKDNNRWWVYSFGNPFEVLIDDAGRLQSFDGRRTTFRVQARRQPRMDLAPIIASFVERERKAGPITALSPRDSTSVRVGSAVVTVNYGAPSARGRRIWTENGVLGDTLWRTGANASTRFTTSAALTFGAGRVLPAGTYTLMTLAVPGRYQLLFYDRDAEILRVPLEARALNPAVERFTITIRETPGPTGVLQLTWDTQELLASFRPQE